jgi:hypothetical protein
MNDWLMLSGAAGTLMAAWGARNLWLDHFRSMPTGSALEGQKVRESRKLKDISHAWTGDVIKLRDIAHIWREIEAGKPEIGRPRQQFSHKEMEEFFAIHVDNPMVKGKRRIVIEKLLKMLDDAGDCPSVVGRGKYENDREPERGYAIERYDCFAGIPLWKHVITVAEAYIARFQYKALVPDALVIALGHDIGMIEAQYAKYYTKLTHPEISILVLKSIPEYTTLENCEEINSIIISHHSITNLKLANILKAADHEVRNVEFTGQVRDPESENAGEIPEQGKADPSQEKEESVMSDNKEVVLNDAKGDPGEFRDGGEPLAERHRSRHALQEIVPLPHWLDLEAILSHMGDRINIIEKSADLGLNWSAYSVREGNVWVKEELLWEAVLKTSGENAASFAAVADKTLRWNILYTVVMELGRRGMVAEEIIKEGFYQVPVTVLSRKRKPFSTYMTPFRPGAFGILPDELEQRKGSLMNDMIRNIVPKQKENPSC